MKIKILFLLGAILCGNLVHGQHTKYLLGIRLSPGLSKMHSNLINYDKKFGYSASFSFEYLLNNHFSAKAELGYERKSSGTEIIIIDNYMVYLYTIDVRINYDYLTFPIYGSYRTNGKVRFIIDLGTNMGYLVSLKTKSVKSTGGETKSKNTAKELNRFDFGLLGGTGAGFPVNDHLGINLGIKGTVGILNLIKHSENKARMKINTVGLYIGITYKI